MAYGPSRIARVLACSAEVVERLDVVPRVPAGERPIATLLTMSRKKFDEVAQCLEDADAAVMSTLQQQRLMR